MCWRLDRFGRSLRALIMAIEELNAFVSMGENIDSLEILPGRTLQIQPETALKRPRHRCFRISR